MNRQTAETGRERSLPKHPIKGKLNPDENTE